MEAQAYQPLIEWKPQHYYKYKQLNPSNRFFFLNLGNKESPQREMKAKKCEAHQVTEGMLMIKFL